LFRDNDLNDITVIVNPQFPTENYDVKFRFCDVIPNVQDCWTLKRNLDLIEETFFLLGDTVFNDDTLKEILNAEIEDVLFIVGARYPTRWIKKVEWKEKKTVEWKFDETYAFLTKNRGGEMVRWAVNTMKDFRKPNGSIMYIQNKYYRSRVFHPNGFIMDLDKEGQLTEIKRGIK